MVGFEEVYHPQFVELVVAGFLFDHYMILSAAIVPRGIHW